MNVGGRGVSRGYRGTQRRIMSGKERKNPGSESDSEGPASTYLGPFRGTIMCARGAEYEREAHDEREAGIRHGARRAARDEPATPNTDVFVCSSARKMTNDCEKVERKVEQTSRKCRKRCVFLSHAHNLAHPHTHLLLRRPVRPDVNATAVRRAWHDVFHELSRSGRGRGGGHSLSEVVDPRDERGRRFVRRWNRVRHVHTTVLNAPCWFYTAVASGSCTLVDNRGVRGGLLHLLFSFKLIST